MDNRIYGYEYEVFIRNHIDKFENVQKVWLWKDVPEQELFNAGLIIDYNVNRKNRLKSKSKHENIAQDHGIKVKIYYLNIVMNINNHHLIKLNINIKILVHGYKLKKIKLNIIQMIFILN